MSPNDRTADRAATRDHKLALIERLADDLAHDIRNPLHSMVINLEVLRRRLTRIESESGQDLLRYANVIGSELERVNRRVDLLLGLARPDPVSSETVSLAEVFAELDELIALERERRDRGLDVEISPEAGARLVHRATSRQLILALLLETLDSLPRGGALRVFAEPGPKGIDVHFHAAARSAPPAEDRLTSGTGELLRLAGEVASEIGGSVESLTVAGASVTDSANWRGHVVLHLPGRAARARPRGNNA